MFSHMISTKKNTAKHWAKARKARTLLVASAKAAKKKSKFKKSQKQSGFVKKKHLKNFKRSEAKERAKLKKLRGSAPPNVRNLNRADALTALAGYRVSNTKIEEHLISEAKWLALLREVGVIGADFSVRDAKHTFIWSRMRALCVSQKPLSGKTKAVTRALCRQARLNIINKQ